MRTSTRTSILALLAGVTASLAVGCGSIEPIDVHDERLPLDARLWVGGAEDAVSIARAAVEDAKVDLRAIASWREHLPGASDVGPAAAGLVPPLHAMADARMDLAERRLDRAEADLALAEARRDLVYAETAMRYDLAVHDLVPLRADRDSAEKDVQARGAAVDEALVLVDKASEAFWSAYRGQASSGGDDTLLWLAVTPKKGVRSSTRQ